MAVESLAVEYEGRHSESFLIPDRFHQVKALRRNDLAVEQGLDKPRQVVGGRNKATRTEKNAGMGFLNLLPVATGKYKISQAFVFGHIDISRGQVSIRKADFFGDSFLQQLL